MTHRADKIIERLEGATIVGGGEDVEGEGIHILLQDGRVLVIAGFFALSLVRPDAKALH